MKERWRTIPGYERYKVSDHGKVVGPGRYKEGTLKASKNSYGYPKVCLYNGKKRGKGMRVHVLVLMAFVGPRPAGMVACHLNDVKTDNRLCNLAWETQAENCRHRIINNSHLAGIDHPMAKLSQADIDFIVKHYQGGRKTNARILAKLFNIHRNSIYRICRREAAHD